jgi:hypothetical protein
MFRKFEAKGTVLPNNVAGLKTQVEQEWLPKFVQLTVSQNQEIQAYAQKVLKCFDLTQIEL